MMINYDVHLLVSKNLSYPNIGIMRASALLTLIATVSLAIGRMIIGK